MTKFLNFINENYSIIFLGVLAFLVLRVFIKNYFDYLISKNFNKDKIRVSIQNNNSVKTIEIATSKLNAKELNRQLMILNEKEENQIEYRKVS